MASFHSWQSDPLLWDKQQLSTNHWQTLNGLLTECEKQLERELLITKPLTNFYGILIRKQDFSKSSNNPNQKGVRILTRMPYLPLNHYQFLRKELAEHSWTIAENARDYFYQSALLDNSVKSWKQRVEHYLDRGAIPLPILRGNEQTWQQLTEQVLKEQHITIQAAKGEQSRIPLVLSEKLVYLLGIIDGDGHLSKHQVHIVDYSKKQIEQLQGFFQELFRVTGDIREGNEGNYYILLVNGKWIIRLVNFITGHPLGRKYDALREPLVLQEEQWTHLRGAYWRGMFDADGCYKQTLIFSTISQNLTKSLSCFLNTWDIKYSINHESRGFNIYIYSGYRARLHGIMGCWHPEKKVEFRKLVESEIRGPGRGKSITFIGINELKLHNDYFDFSLLPRNLGVYQAGPIMKSIRYDENLSKREISNQLKISYELLSAYEANRATPPLSKLISFIKLFSDQELMSFIDKWSLLFYKTSKSITKLPLKPSSILIEYMEKLIPRKNNYITLKEKNPLLRKKILDFFEISQINFNKFRFSNLALHSFLTTFGVYR